MMEELDQCRSLLATVDDADKKHRAITFRLNTDAIDDHQTVIEPRGVRLEYYRSVGSPVLWDHGLDARRGKDPIAKNEWTKAQGNKRAVLLSRNHFHKDEFSQQRFEWYQDEVLKGISLRFRQPNTDEYGPPTQDEIRSRPELDRLRSVWNQTQGRRGWVLRAWDLAEQSCTPLPSNPETIAIEDIRSIMECCRSGMWLPDDVKTQLEARMSDSLGGLEGGGATGKPGRRDEEEDGEVIGEEPDDEDSAKRFVEEEGGEYVVKSEKGKALGKYKSKASAEKRLGQIEYFKHKKERALDGPHVIQDGTNYRIMLGERCLHSLDDEAMASAYLATISDETDHKRSPEYLAFLSRSRHEAFEERMKRTINEYVEFRCYGALGHG